MSNQKTAERRQATAAPKVDLGELVESHKSELEPLVLENGKSVHKLMSTFWIAVQESPKLRECTPESILKELKKCARDGLVPDAKEAVILPYWNGDIGAHEANYQPMVYGVIKRVKELGGVYSITCQCAYENDTFEYRPSELEAINHEVPFNQPRGNVVLAYVIFRDQNKDVIGHEVVPLEELLKARNQSKSPNSPAWDKWTTEMYRKVALRRGSKYITLDNDKIRELIERTDSMFEFSQQSTEPQRADPFSGTTLELRAETEPTPSGTQSGGNQGVKKPAEGKADNKPKQAEPKPWEIKVNESDVPDTVQFVSKIVELVFDDKQTPPERQKVMAGMAANWSEDTPDYLKPLYKHIVDFCNNALKGIADKQKWDVPFKANLQKISKLLGEDFLEQTPLAE